MADKKKKTPARNRDTTVFRDDTRAALGQVGNVLPKVPPVSVARLSRMGAAEVAEGYHEKLPHFALHDLLLENDWHHDQRTLDLLSGDVPVPKGHSVKAKVVPTGDGSHKVVAWHDEAPFHVRHGADLLRLRGGDAVYGHPFDHVTHGPGGLFGVRDTGGDDYRDVFDLHPAHGFMRSGLSPRHFDTYEAAVAHAEERARGTTH